MQYYTYWSILDTPSHTIKSNYVALIIAGVALLSWVLIKRFQKESANKSLSLWGAGLFFGLGLSMFFLFTYFYPDNSERETLKLISSYPVVEGVVFNFQDRSNLSNKQIIQSFTVDSVQFAYGDALLGKFNSFSEVDNRVLFNGQRVRVTYKESTIYNDQYHAIVKLEIAKPNR